MAERPKSRIAEVHAALARWWCMALLRDFAPFAGGIALALVMVQVQKRINKRRGDGHDSDN